MSAVTVRLIGTVFMLSQMTRRLYARDTFESAVQVVLDDAIALHGAEFGDIQLSIADELLLVAARNFSAPFIQTFRRVRRSGGCVCGRAFRAGGSLIVADIEVDPDFLPFRQDGRAAGFRGVQSTPIAAASGTLVGMISTHFANPHEPAPIEMATLRSYVTIAANHLYRLLGAATLEDKARQMNASLCEQYGLLAEAPLPPVNAIVPYLEG
jgi:GAF domain-containing protein